MSVPAKQPQPAPAPPATPSDPAPSCPIPGPVDRGAALEGELGEDS